MFQLNAIKTCGLGASVVALLFFTCSTSKFCIVQQDDKQADSLELNKTYFVKNAKKNLDDVYVASNNTVIKMSKKTLQDAQRFIFFYK